MRKRKPMPGRRNAWCRCEGQWGDSWAKKLGFQKETCEDKTKEVVWSQRWANTLECRNGEELCCINKREAGWEGWFHSYLAVVEGGTTESLWHSFLLPYFHHGPRKWKGDLGHNIGICGADAALMGPKQQDTKNQKEVGKEEAEREGVEQGRV